MCIISGCHVQSTRRRRRYSSVSGSIIKTAAFAKEFLEDLEEGAEIYRRIFELQSFKWKKEGVTFTLPCCSANVPCQAAVAVSILAFARLL
jgi:hypothetical protein